MPIIAVQLTAILVQSLYKVSTKVRKYMKTRTILIISALVALTGCGNAAHWGSSSTSQKYQDDIYRKVETVNRETRDSIRFETDALASKTRETQLYLRKSQSDTIFVPENKAVAINLQDNSYDLLTPTWTYSISTPWYYPGWNYSWYRPWYNGGWYSWRSWDPWYWSSWYYDPWHWNSWHWSSWYSWDPWYWSTWYWDPWYSPWYSSWYSPWYSPWHSSYYYGWHSPYYHSWHGGWYGGWHGGYGHRDISYGPRNRTIGHSRSAASRGGAAVSHRPSSHSGRSSISHSSATRSSDRLAPSDVTRASRSSASRSSASGVTPMVRTSSSDCTRAAQTRDARRRSVTTRRHTRLPCA